jgi:predicted nucleic acid-binding protein
LFGEFAFFEFVFRLFNRETWMFLQGYRASHKTRASKYSLLLLVCFLCGTISSSTGCVSVIANLIHVIKGDKVPAPCDKLEEKRVALVVNSESGMNDMAVVMLGRNIRDLLNQNVKKIDLAPQDQVEKWADDQDWENIDYQAIGKGVKADYVVAVDMIGLELRDGDTLYRGQCDVFTTVYEVSTGKPIYKTSIVNFAFPSVGGQPVTGTDEGSFRRLYLGIVAERVARNFYPYNPSEDIAADAEALQF